jgi:xanthine dehydrogenase YagR molybdenum-binding subunit
MPARNERGDVDAGLAQADARSRPAIGWRPTTTTRRTRRRSPSGTAATSRSTSRRRHPATQQTVAGLLGLPIAHVRVITLRRRRVRRQAMVWPNVTLTAMAARHVGRPVKLMLTRPQMFTSNGHREAGAGDHARATRAGRLTAIRHEKPRPPPPFDDGPSPRPASPRSSTPATTTSACTGSSRPTP